MDKSGFSHEVLFYESDEEFLEGTAGVVRQTLEAGGKCLIAVRRSNAELLQGELGRKREGAEFVDMEAVGRNPARIIAVWRDFLDRAAETSVVLGIGEPVWPGRDESELDECRRHESLLNRAFGGGREWSLLCPYDSRVLDGDVLRAAEESHSHLYTAAGRSESRAWPGSMSEYSPFGGRLSEAPAEARSLEFGRADLGQVRHLVVEEASQAALSDERRQDIVVAVSELAANSVLHGGGRGTLQVWREPEAVVAEVRDKGLIEQPLAGRVRPEPDQEGGRGLWMVNQVSDLVQIRSGVDGTGVRVRMRRG